MGLDIDKATENVGKIDNFLTSLKGLLKKHFGIIIILLLGALGYWFWTLVDAEVENQIQNEEYYHEEGYYDEEGYDNEGGY
jgi:hypothetical protein